MYDLFSHINNSYNETVINSFNNQREKKKLVLNKIDNIINKRKVLNEYIDDVTNRYKKNNSDGRSVWDWSNMEKDVVYIELTTIQREYLCELSKIFKNPDIYNNLKYFTYYKEFWNLGEGSQTPTPQIHPPYSLAARLQIGYQITPQKLSDGTINRTIFRIYKKSMVHDLLYRSLNEIVASEIHSYRISC